MKIALSLLLLISACSSVPKKVQTAITQEKLAGYWVDEKQFLEIKCDGAISFKVRSSPFLFRSDPYDQNEGKIKELTGKFITYRSVLGFKSTIKYSRPVKNSQGCWVVQFDGKELVGGTPIDCVKTNAETLSQKISSAMKAKPDPCYQ